ncbi:MAG TPA: BON domain-containing protein [Vicinamibacterales bacterium]|nr:BON domain-containing protein [Vicinamibacterales bacterium]
MRVIFGAPVWSSERRVGRVAAVEIEPASGRAAAIVYSADGRLGSHAHTALPRRFRYVDGRLMLAAGPQPVTDGIRADHRLLTSRTPVVAPDARARLAGVALDDDGVVREVFVKPSWWRSWWTAPLAEDAFAADGELRVISTATWRPYVDDARLLGMVQRRLLGDPVLRALDARNIEIHVDDGRVRLTGGVSTADMRARAIELARSVGGVREVRAELKTDAELTVELREAIARNPQLAGVEAAVCCGTAELRGSATYDASLLAVKIARSIPGVRDVANYLTVVSLGGRRAA